MTLEKSTGVKRGLAEPYQLLFRANGVNLLHKNIYTVKNTDEKTNLLIDSYSFTLNKNKY
jgi:hypothetical protein